jgi:hypothetical protein
MDMLRVLINGNIRVFNDGYVREFIGRIGCANAVKIASFLSLRILLIRQENESEKWCDSSHPTYWEKDR